MRITCLAFVSLLLGCVNVDNICPHKPITQGVFGEILDASGVSMEQNVEVDIYTTLNGVKDTMFGGAATTRGGYAFHVDPSTYALCAKNVCTTVVVPTGLVEVSAMDNAAALTWDAPVGVPPGQMVGPCKYGE